MSGPDAAKIGLRVSMLIRDEDGSRRELLGKLLTTSTIVKKDLTEVKFDPDTVISWRVVPEQPVRKPTSQRIREIERASSQTWPATEVVRLGGWELRASGGFSHRANSVLPIGAPPFGEPTGDLAAALKQVIDFYRSRNLMPRFQVPLPSYGALNVVLDEEGWQPGLSVSVQIGDLAVLASAPQHDVSISSMPDDGWIEVFPPQLGRDGLAVLTGGGAFFATIYQLDPGSHKQVVAAIGRGAVSEGWFVITAINTISQFQHHGLATSIIRALSQHAQSFGAEKAFLQVSAANAPALALYRQLGFRQHHTYNHRSIT